ncbi:endo-1,4-beta-xylanase [Halomarina salina]|uniref:endo-1,4-beta-xylanase n=1 Tax=Halomarina salina TaxID=1872699 RepID=A0ABD5RSN1_9EURY|nr:endo-1,4-beta-xylanase [Halomarina salina]
MSEKPTSRQYRRRTYLQTLAALGVGAAGTSAVATAQSSSDDASGDAYHRTLRSDLTGRGGNKTLPPGQYVYGETEAATMDAFSVVGDATATTTAVEDDAVPITTATRIEVEDAHGRPGAVSYRGPVEDHSFSAGDVLLGVAYLRSDSRKAQVEARFGYDTSTQEEDGGSAKDHDGGSPDNAVQRSALVEPGDTWMRYFFPIEVGEAPGSDATPVFEFLLGSCEQTVEVAGVALIDYSDAETVPTLGTLPPYDYEGRAEDAEWREAAEERIDEIRKTDVEVTVVDSDGEPVPHAYVDVAMTEHAFDFGSAVAVPRVTGDSEDDETYREVFLEEFNKAVVENGMKWPAWEGVWDISNEATRETLGWLDDHDVPTRGHYLLWEEYGTDGGGGMNVDSGLPADEVRQTITEKIANHGERFDGQVTEWDMHNHPIWQSAFRDDEALGWDAVAEWWAAADDATDAELYTNEMGAIGGTWQQDPYYQFVQRLVEEDYPIDGIGFMGHHQQQWGQLLDVDELLAGLDRFGAFDLPLLVTEFDIEIISRRNAQDVDVQRDYTRDFLTAVFSHEAVEGVLSWGFWAGDHWRPTGAYYDEDWTLRPNGEQYLDLVFDEWWTEEVGRTGRDGTFSTRGFEGDYHLVASDGHRVGHAEATFDDENGTVEVELRPLSEVATDVDGDGRTEDVDGDGDVDNRDAGLFFKNLRSDDVQEHPEQFDFDGDGDLDFRDVVALFREAN